VRAVVLAAGEGTRLRPLTERLPKILAPLAGSTLLERQLAYLRRNGVSEVALNAHHRADQVVEAVGRLETPPTVRISVEPRLLGTAGALVPLGDFLAAGTLLLYGDVVTDADLAALVARHRDAGALATLATYRSTRAEGKGVVDHDADGCVCAFVEKGAGAAAGEVSVNAGIHVLEPEILDFVSEGADFGYDVWPAVLEAGLPLLACELDRPVYDVGTPETLEAAGAALADGSLRW
jgi:NDP-sugar pyrophosphorylase family protein